MDSLRKWLNKPKVRKNQDPAKNLCSIKLKNGKFYCHQLIFKFSYHTIRKIMETLNAFCDVTFHEYFNNKCLQ